MLESIVLRTDFSEQARRDAAIAAMSTPSEPDGFLAAVSFIEDRSFRVTAAELWSVENTLSLANMDFDAGSTA